MSKGHLGGLLTPSESWDDVQLDSVFLCLAKCAKGHRRALGAKL